MAGNESNGTSEEFGDSEMPTPVVTGTPVLWLLGLGFFAALLACMFVHAHVRDGLQMAKDFDRELPALGRFYSTTAPLGFVVSVVLLIAGLAVTRVARVNRKLGVIVSVLLFAFVLFWAGGAVFAFVDVFDPPRTNRQSAGDMLQP